MQKMCGRKITSCLFAAHFFADDTADAEFIVARKLAGTKKRYRKTHVAPLADLSSESVR